MASVKSFKCLPAMLGAGENGTIARRKAEIFAILLAESYVPINIMPPSAWGGHIPFLFGLVAILKPRRFVELGTHHGASFLAFCQAAKQNSLMTHAIAVDTWEGDFQAGLYDSKVFEALIGHVEQYKFAELLRTRFELAVKDFEPSSIDLLHVDGLHTYEAVKQDYDLWVPKMSSDSMLLFHDINVFEREFGVWRLWEEIKNRHPSASFSHAHGLGIVSLSNDSNSSGRMLIKLLNDPYYFSLLQKHYECIGPMQVELANSRKKLLKLIAKKNSRRFRSYAKRLTTFLNR